MCARTLGGLLRPCNTAERRLGPYSRARVRDTQRWREAGWKKTRSSEHSTPLCSNLSLPKFLANLGASRGFIPGWPTASLMVLWRGLRRRRYEPSCVLGKAVNSATVGCPNCMPCSIHPLPRAAILLLSCADQGARIDCSDLLQSFCAVNRYFECKFFENDF